MLKPIENYFKYGKTDSKRFGMKIFNDFKYHIPEKDVAFEAIPGVSGDAIVSQNRYQNIELEFHCRIFKPPEFHTLDQESVAISKWLNSQTDYSFLYFTKRPSYLYEAFFDGQTEIEKESDEKGELTVKFNCMPFVLRQEGLNYFEQVYQNTSLLNKQFVAPNYDFPELVTDKNVISVNNSMVKFEIQPRWRTLA